MAPISLWLAAPLAILLSSVRPSLATDDDVGGDLTSAERHEMRRAAMDAAVERASSSSAVSVGDHSTSSYSFASPREWRSYYYFHAGMERAARNAIDMSGGDADEMVEENEDVYLHYLEALMKGELANVRERLGELEAGATEADVGPGSSGRGGAVEGGDDGSDKAESDANGSSETTTGADEGGEEKEELTLEKRLQAIYKGEYSHFKCGGDDRAPVSPSDVEGKLSMLRERFYKFAGADRPPPSESSDDEPVPSPDLNIDYVNIENNGDESVATKELGLFAARDFESGEVVYSRRPNALYFQDESTWVSFIRSLPENDDACLALELSSMKRISSPGRLMLDILPDEGGFMRRLRGGGVGAQEGEESESDRIGNVTLEDDRSFDYVASRDIKTGEEIVEKAKTESEE